MAEPRHFLDIDLVTTAELRRMLDLGHAYKRARTGVSVPRLNGTARAANGHAAPAPRPLAGKTLAMIFEKPSTRTRVSFEVGMKQLGGEVVVLSQADTQLGRGEPIADTARVLSRYVDIIMMRTKEHAKIEEMARHATVPVINGLTDRSHPCQIMADLMTLEERKGGLGGRVVAWSGDGNNVATSWIHAAVRLGFELRVATPEPLRPEAALLDWAVAEGGHVIATDDPEAAVRGADCVVTDTWISMGVQMGAENSLKRHNLLTRYRVDARLMRLAAPDALFMHCLPAKRGEEVTPEVIDGPQSAVWDEAENRLHAQKGILAWCLG